LLGLLFVNGTLALALIAIYVLLLVVILPGIGITSRNVDHFLATVGVAVAVWPLRWRLTHLSNYLLQREWQDAQVMLLEMTNALSRTISPEAIRALLVDDLPGRLRLRGAMLWMLEPPDDRVLIALGCHPVLEGCELLVHGVGAGQIEQASGYLDIVAYADQDWAKSVLTLGIQLAFPLRIGEKLIGIYGCAAPVSGGLYPPHVVNLLLTLAPAVAGAIENARAYTVIARLNQQLYALDRLKDEFIESVGHELRTPLTSLNLATQLLVGNPSLANEMTEILEENVARLRDLIARVLSFRSAEPPTTITTLVELSPLLYEVVSIFDLAAQTHGIQLTICAADDLCVQAESGRLRRAIHEIVDNAVRYGGNGRIFVTATSHDGLVFVSISDTGSGIPENEQPLLFTPFYRGHRTRAIAMTPGVGLGLSIARREVEAIGGRVWLDQTGPQGTTICLALHAAMAKKHERAVGE
jgi:signal transduction histidine kinase